MIGRTISHYRISHYRITNKLGEGGMGVVYKAASGAIVLRSVCFTAVIDAAFDGQCDALTAACDLQGRLGVPVVFLTYHGRDGCHPNDEIVWVVKSFEDRELLRLVKKLLRPRRLRLRPSSKPDPRHPVESAKLKSSTLGS